MVDYLKGKFRNPERRWIIAAALVLLPVFFLPVLPIWTMKLWAPQYPEGLTLMIYTNTIRGDIQKINTLNHYVGMHPITPNDFAEFSYLPQLLTFFGVMALLAALWNRRWIAAVGWIAFTGFAVYMFRDYAIWLWHYGHDLDPRAAIKLPSFTPPLIGYQKMANFKVWSLPGPGTLLLGFAWLLGPIVLFLDHRAKRAAVVPARGARGTVAAMLVAGMTVAAPHPADAAARSVPAGADVGRAIQSAAAGDVIVLERGVHRGPVRLDRPVTLRGVPGAVLSGGGSGTVLTVVANGARVEDLEVRGTGARVDSSDAAVRVLGARDVTLARLRIRDALYGIYGERSDRLIVERCHLTGRVRPLDEFGSGNGIHLWYAADAVLREDTVERFADGIYLSFADRTGVLGSRMLGNGRYGLHTMYCQGIRLVENLFTRNLAGCAIMFSNNLEIERNAILHNRGPRTYGLLLRDCSAGTFRGNRLVDNTVAIFMDNSNRNRIEENLFQENGWGLLLFSSCAGNEAIGNVFIQNDYPVALDMRHSDNRFDDGRMGNYWSENAPYDLDGDGVGDVPYSPVSAFAFLSKQYPDLSLLAKSPAVAAITVAERVFPALRPSEIVDSRPLIQPPALRRVAAESPAAPKDVAPAWPAAGGFGGLLTLGLWGLRRGGTGR